MHCVDTPSDMPSSSSATTALGTRAAITFSGLGRLRWEYSGRRRSILVFHVLLDFDADKKFQNGDKKLNATTTTPPKKTALAIERLIDCDRISDSALFKKVFGTRSSRKNRSFTTCLTSLLYFIGLASHRWSRQITSKVDYLRLRVVNKSISNGFSTVNPKNCSSKLVFRRMQSFGPRLGSTSAVQATFFSNEFLPKSGYIPTKSFRSDLSKRIDGWH